MLCHKITSVFPTPIEGTRVQVSNVMDSGEKNENLQVLSHAESGNHLLLKFDRAYR